jgi:hypothetical protein
MVFCSAGYEFEFEYLGEFEIEIKNILEHESGAHMGLIHEKNQRPKISCYCTFKGRLVIDEISFYQQILLGSQTNSSADKQTFRNICKTNGPTSINHPVLVY